MAFMVYAPTFWPNGWAIPVQMKLFHLVRHKFVAGFMKLRQRAPFGIKDERLRNFVLEAFRNGERPIEDILGRGGKMVWEFSHLAARGSPQPRQDQAAHDHLPSAS